MLFHLGRQDVPGIQIILRHAMKSAAKAKQHVAKRYVMLCSQRVNRWAETTDDGAPRLDQSEASANGVSLSSQSEILEWATPAFPQGSLAQLAARATFSRKSK